MRAQFALLAVALLAIEASADTIRMSTNDFSAGNGGEFTATVLTGNAGLTGDAPTSLSATSFQTFCLEAGENIRSGNIYSFSLSTAAMLGGGGATNGMDPLDARTAFLYTRFRQGNLPGYDYSPAGREDSARRLQRAIWFIEEESGGANNAFVALANAAVAPGGEWFGVGIGDVRVMNLSSAEFPNAQDQLTLLPRIPTPGAAALLGLAGLAGFRRRR
jgi:hypothetical protein